MGADIVIAVEISVLTTKAKKTPSLTFSRSRSSSNYLVQRSTQEQAATLTDDDFFLRPGCGANGNHRLPDKMPTAYHADTKQQGSIGISFRCAFECGLPTLYWWQAESSKAASMVIKRWWIRLVINNNTHYSDKLIANRLNLDSGKVLKPVKLNPRLKTCMHWSFWTGHLWIWQCRWWRSTTGRCKWKSWGPNYLLTFDFIWRWLCNRANIQSVCFANLRILTRMAQS